MFNQKLTINYIKQSINNSDIKAINGTLKSNFLTQGPKTHEFEKLKVTGAMYSNLLIAHPQLFWYRMSLGLKKLM